MSTWRKIVLRLIIAALAVCTFVFWGSLIGVCCVVALIYGFQAYLYIYFASAELAKTFEENGKNVEGWR